MTDVLAAPVCRPARPTAIGAALVPVHLTVHGVLDNGPHLDAVEYARRPAQVAAATPQPSNRAKAIATMAATVGAGDSWRV